MNATLIHLAVLGPPLVMAAFQLGRSPGSIVLTIYVLYALTTSNIYRRLPPALALLLFGYLSAMALSLLLYGIDTADGFRELLKLSLVTIATLYATQAVVERPESVRGMTLALFIIALSAPLDYLARLIHHYMTSEYQMIALLNGLHVAALAPLGLAHLGRKPVHQGLWIAMITALLAIGTSRSEMLMIFAGFLSVYAFHHRHILWLLIAIPVAIIAALGYGVWVRPHTLIDAADLYAFLDNLSSYRLQLWGLAKDHPPENLWIGVGMAQSPHYFHSHNYPYDSFHNAFLGIWYEGGWIGLALVVLAYGLMFGRIGTRYRELDGEGRWIYACLFGSAVASLCASMVDRGHTSILFSNFLLYCGLMLYWYRPMPRSGVDG